MLGHLGAMLSHLGAMLGLCWGHVGPMLAHLGAILGLCWAILGLGVMLALSWAILGLILGPSWGYVGARDPPIFSPIYVVFVEEQKTP